jgi:hypothetical protein
LIPAVVVAAVDAAVAVVVGGDGSGRFQANKPTNRTVQAALLTIKAITTRSPLQRLD